jgi:methanethiol oxidase
MVRFYRQEDNTWAKNDAIVIPPYRVEGWALPYMPGLITDFVISLDDRQVHIHNYN